MRSRPYPAAVALLLALAPGLAAQSEPAPLTSVRNYQVVADRLASSGQIGYDQIPLIAEAGYEVVINLAVADEERNGREGFVVAQEGMTYIHIPVDWQEPTLDDLQIFFDVMQASAERKVYVHCFANMRASAFVYLWRTLVEGESESVAKATMDEVWDPAEVEQWGALIERAQARHAGAR